MGDLPIRRSPPPAVSHLDPSVATARFAPYADPAIREAALRVVVDGGDSLVVVDGDGIIRWASEAAQGLHPHAPPLLGLPLWRLCGTMEDPGLVALVRDVIATGAPRSLLPVGDGEGRWFCGSLVRGGDDAVVVLAWEVTSRVRQAQWLAAEGELLGAIATGTPLPQVLERLARTIEGLLPATRASVMLVDREGRLQPAAAPSLPASYVQAVAGTPIGPDAGACGSAAWHRTTIISRDIETDPKWAAFRDLVRPIGMRACWAAPIIGLREPHDEGTGTRVVGTLALYAATPRAPGDAERYMLQLAAQFAAVAIAAAETRAGEARLARILEETTDFVGIADPEGRVLWLNRAARTLFGYAGAGASEGRHVLEHYTDDVVAQFLADPNDNVWVRTLREGQWRGESTLKLADGTAVPVSQLVLAHPDADGTVRFLSTIARDRSAEREAEAALAASVARFRALIEAAPVGVYETDLAGKCTYANAALAEMTGWSTEALLGDAWVGAVHPEDAPRVLDDWARYLGPLHKEPTDYRFVRPDGTVRHLRWTAAPLRDGSGRVTGHVGIVSDVTAQTEEAVAQEALAQERARLAQRAEHPTRMESLGALAGGVAHDFNNLLTVIHGGLELLREHLDDGSAPRDEVETIAAAVLRAGELTQRLLAFSRHQVLQPTACDPNVVVEGTVALLARLIGEEIALRTVLVPVHGTILADRGQLEQVLVNLVVNARDAMPCGGTITIATMPTTGREEPAWTGAPDAPLVRLTVTDDGEGMDATTLARAMEPFFTTKPVGRGTGLGLAMAYGVIAQSGGQLALASAPKRGTTVTILLPRTPASPTPTPVATPVVPPEAGGVRRVLVVEDDAAVRAMVRRTLERFGWAVREATNGAEGLAAWHAAPGDVDVLLTDLRMPELGGRAMVDRIRAAGGAALPVVYMSGYADDVVEVMTARESFLAKPFQARTLVATLERVLAAATR